MTLFEIRDGLVNSGRLYLEDVESGAASIEDAVEDLSGLRPDPSRQSDMEPG